MTDFETHETGTFEKINIQNERIKRLELEREALMFFLNYDDAELERAVEFYEKARFVPVPCTRCGKETSMLVSRDRLEDQPLATCGECRQ